MSTQIAEPIVKVASACGALAKWAGHIYYVITVRSLLTILRGSLVLHDLGWNAILETYSQQLITHKK